MTSLNSRFYNSLRAMQKILSVQTEVASLLRSRHGRTARPTTIISAWKSISKTVLPRKTLIDHLSTVSGFSLIIQKLITRRLVVFSSPIVVSRWTLSMVPAKDLSTQWISDWATSTSIPMWSSTWVCTNRLTSEITTNLTSLRLTGLALWSQTWKITSVWSTSKDAMLTPCTFAQAP